jgi:hypothetical protein
MTSRAVIPEIGDIVVPLFHSDRVMAMAATITGIGQKTTHVAVDAYTVGPPGG